jgi:hypothetical protein
MKSGSDRWVIASGIGVALAAFAALWGASFAERESKKGGAISEGDKPAQAAPTREIHMKAKAEGGSRIYQSGRDQTINDQ